jgi:hypothetical protein
MDWSNWLALSVIGLGIGTMVGNALYRAIRDKDGDE